MASVGPGGEPEMGHEAAWIAREDAIDGEFEVVADHVIARLLVRADDVYLGSGLMHATREFVGHYARPAQRLGGKVSERTSTFTPACSPWSAWSATSEAVSLSRVPLLCCRTRGIIPDPLGVLIGPAGSQRRGGSAN